MNREQKEMIELRKWCVQAAVELIVPNPKATAPKAADVIAYAKELEAYICEGKRG